MKINTVNSKGQLVRWESYERDKENMIASHFNGYWVIMNFGKKTKTKKKEIPVRQYRVWKEDGEVHCNCPSHSEKNEICKHMILVSETVKHQNEVKQAAARQEEEERTARVLQAVSKW